MNQIDKSIMTIKLWVDLINYEMNALYVTKNSISTDIFFFEKLKGSNYE